LHTGKFINVRTAQIQKILHNLNRWWLNFLWVSEHSFHAHKLDSTEKFVPIPLLNEDKAKYSRGVRPACPNTENITPLELHGVKYSMTLPERSFHGKDLNSSEKSVSIPPLEPSAVKCSMALPEHSFHAKEPNSNEKSVPIPLLNEEKSKWPCGVRTACSDAKNITLVEPPAIKFSMALLEHSLRV
jgi:hypothetical protein